MSKYEVVKHYREDMIPEYETDDFQEAINYCMDAGLSRDDGHAVSIRRDYNSIFEINYYGNKELDIDNCITREELLILDDNGLIDDVKSEMQKRGFALEDKDVKESEEITMDKSIKEKVDELLSSGDERFPYMMLDRMRQDCEYYLGNGNRYAGHLWAGNEKDQIAYMKTIYERFSKDDRPEWLPYDKILEYEGKMCGVEVLFTFGSWEKYPFEMGYISITAPSVKMAIEEFRRNYPDVNEGVLNCADYYYTEESKARIREHGNGAGCHRRIVVESKDLDECIARATRRSEELNAGVVSKSDVEFEKE